MPEQLLFATQNLNKYREIKPMVPENYELLHLDHLDFTGELVENEKTLEGNALSKARQAYKMFNLPVFADDTGLEVEVLNGMPGVYSARYAGPGKEAAANVEKLLQELQGKTNRKACFRTIIALIRYNEEFLFEGKVCGQIIATPAGMQGFGYDPVFIPDGSTLTYAQMMLDQKNKTSHRARAVQKLIQFLRNR